MQAIKRVTKFIYQRYLILAMGSMAQGLFASLIIGLIFSQLAKIPGLSFLVLEVDGVNLLGAQSPVIGAAIGVAVAYGLKSAPLAIFSAAGTGAFAYAIGGGPMGAYLAAIASAECGRLVAGKTPIDIVLVPFTAILAGGLVGKVCGPAVGDFMVWLGTVVNEATRLQPFLMGIVVSAVMGLVLTAPISSAALAISMGLTGLAAGASTAGCCAHMVGFAVASYAANGVGGLLSQGLGTSMLQVPNILRKPAILMPAVCTSVIMGPVATMLLTIENNPAGAGMGTSGLVGPINAWISMTAASMEGWPWTLAKILLVCVVLPAVLAWLFNRLFVRLGWYKNEHMKLTPAKKND